MAVDTGQGHYVEGITLSSGILMTAFCHRSISSTFAPHTPSSRSFITHFSTSSSFTPFVTRNQLFSLFCPPPPPAQCQALHTHTRSNAHPPRIQTHTLTLRTALLSPSKLLRSFTHSLTQSYFSMVAFVPFISSKTKDSCARRTEGRSGMESRTGRKRS